MTPGEICIVISTGSQAEPRSALAHRRHRATADGSRSRENDTVVLSSTPVPGNEARVYRMIDRPGPARRSSPPQRPHGPAHVSGHGKQEELQALHRTAAARVLRARAWRVPSPRGAHRALAEGVGMAADNVVLLATDGDQVVLEPTTGSQPASRRSRPAWLHVHPRRPHRRGPRRVS